MIDYVVASKDEIELLMQVRLEMLREVNGLPPEYAFSEAFIAYSREYFLNGRQTTILALDGGVIGCATICYMEMMPTVSHPTGKRAHLMNVYTKPQYRRQGIALRMLRMLIREAQEQGVTEISLDATQQGRPLYSKCGFAESDECMVLNLNSQA